MLTILTNTSVTLSLSKGDCPCKPTQ
jgi:hypothetical protein